MKKLTVLCYAIALSTSMYSQVIEDGSYYIMSVQSGDCIEVEKSEENGKIIQSVCEDKETQRFDLTHISDDNFTISNLAVGHNSKSNGAHIYNSNQSDEFKIELIDNSYKIKSKNSNKYITAKIFSDDIIQYHGHNNDAQLWDIIIDFNPITCNSSISCYDSNSNIVLHNGVILTKTNGYYQRSSDNKYLAKNYNNQFVENTNLAEYVAGKTVDNLWYDNGNGSMPWSEGNSLCLSRGWRLPTKDESNGKIILDGGYYYAWTTTNHPLRSYWLHHPTNFNEYQWAASAFTVICVK